MSFAQANAAILPLADDSVDLVFTSPPYIDARLYLESGQDIGIARKCGAWVEWMLAVVAECVRVSRGLVIVNCAGKTEDWCYQPGPEGLLWEWFKRGGRAWRPCHFHRVGIPGSGGKQWYRADTEYLLAFTKCRKAVPWGEPTANGHAPKWAPGGQMSHRLGSGARVNQWGQSFDQGGRAKIGDRISDARIPPSHQLKYPTRINQDGIRGEKRVGAPRYDGVAKANPGNVVKLKVGGGVMGSKLAHENEAPFPEALPAYFIKSHCPPGGIVLDPFSGSGTTVAAALKLGRRGIGFDLRMSQCRLGHRRVSEECGIFGGAKMKIPRLG